MLRPRPSSSQRRFCLRVCCSVCFVEIFKFRFSIEFCCICAFFLFCFLFFFRFFRFFLFLFFSVFALLCFRFFRTSFCSNATSLFFGVFSFSKLRFDFSFLFCFPLFRDNGILLGGPEPPSTRRTDGGAPYAIAGSYLDNASLVKFRPVGFFFVRSRAILSR